MSMMSILSCTSAMSAEGATCMEADQFDEAYDFFAKALDLVVRAESTWLKPTPAVENADALDPAVVDILIKSLPKYQATTAISRTESGTQNELRSFKDDAFFVYDEPLLFVPESDITPRNVAFYKAVLLFDIALTLHKKSNCVDSWCVYRALHFYELCLECVQDCADHNNCLELSAAALNNKAHIYFEHGEFGTARTVLDTLLVNMIFMHGRPLEFEEQNTQGILFNLYMLRMPTSARTA